MAHSWLIGSGADCDVVVGRPSVSVHHCRLTRPDGGDVVLEDLGSPYGTFVNGARLTSPARVTPGDAVTLGPTTPLPWPHDAIPPAYTILTIGREPDNAFTVNLGTVSGYHARLIWNAGTRQATIEDLGSSNGTALASLERKITRAPLAATDTVFLGTHSVPAAVLLARVNNAPAPPPPLTFRGYGMIVGRDPACDLVVDVPIVSGRHARLSRSGGQILIEDLASANGTFVNGQRVERPVAVVPGDQIRLGNQTLVLVDTEAKAPAPVVPTVAMAPPHAPAATLPLNPPAATLPLNPPASAAPRRSLWPLLAIAALVPLGAGLYLAIAAPRPPSVAEVENPPPAATPPIETAQRPKSVPGPVERPEEAPAPKPPLTEERIVPPAPVVIDVPAPPRKEAEVALARPIIPPPPAPEIKTPVPGQTKPKRPHVQPPADQPPEPVLAWADSLDLSNLTPEQENRLGDELHAMVLKQVRPAEDGPLLKRTLDAARRVSDAEFTITILDSNAVNAFSLPGGHIYLCRGLFDLIGADEDYILEFVLGHEIAHLTLNHARANAVEARKHGVDTLNQFLVPIALGYRDAQESEADAWIYQRMIVQPDATKRTCLAFLRKLRDYAERHGFSEGHKPPEPDKGFTLYENHFRAHPAAHKRLKQLESYSAKSGAPSAKKGTQP